MIIAFVGYLLLAVHAGLTGVITITYARMFRVAKGGRRLLPVHVILVAVGTLLLSGTAVARQITYGPVWWVVPTYGSIGMITLALALVWHWQRQRPVLVVPPAGPPVEPSS